MHDRMEFVASSRHGSPFRAGRAVATGLLFALTCVPSTSQAAAPYPKSAVIDTLLFDWSTHVRRASGSDNWPLTWSDDDNQYASYGDGGGFAGTNDQCRVSLGISRIQGTADSYAGVDVWGYPGCAENPATMDGKTYALVSIGGALYLWRAPGSDTSNLDYQRLFKSTDHGANWTDTGVEFTYATHGIGLFGFLQYGKDYQGARDGYVYIYATVFKNYAWGTQSPGELVLLRAPRTGLEDASQYQFYAGMASPGTPRWGTFAERVPVFTDPNGVVIASAIYDPGLGRYILTTCHSSWNSGNLGVFDAPEPWGPWTTAAYFTGWPPGGEVERSTFYANIAPKWWSAGGAEFVFVFTGSGGNDSWNSVRGRFVTGSPDTKPPDPVTDLAPSG